MRLCRVLVLAALVWALALGVAEAKAHHPPARGGWTSIELHDGALDDLDWRKMNEPTVVL